VPLAGALDSIVAWCDWLRSDADVRAVTLAQIERLTGHAIAPSG
jgi:hypothetical protein